MGSEHDEAIELANRTLKRVSVSVGPDDDLATLARALLRSNDVLEQIALLDFADGHELTWEHASEAVALATNLLGKHPSQIVRK